MLGAILSVSTFITTVTIIPFMPDGWNESAGGFPAMQGNVAFLMKDVVFVAVSIYLLKEDAVRVYLSAVERRVWWEINYAARVGRQAAAAGRHY